MTMTQRLFDVNRAKLITQRAIVNQNVFQCNRLDRDSLCAIVFRAHAIARRVCKFVYRLKSTLRLENNTWAKYASVSIEIDIDNGSDCFRITAWTARSTYKQQAVAAAQQKSIYEHDLSLLSVYAFNQQKYESSESADPPDNWIPTSKTAHADWLEIKLRNNFETISFHLLSRLHLHLCCHKSSTSHKFI